VPRGMRESRLLREQQQEDTEKGNDLSPAHCLVTSGVTTSRVPIVPDSWSLSRALRIKHCSYAALGNALERMVASE
jgi:hypothetical protein